MWVSWICFKITWKDWPAVLHTPKPLIWQHISLLKWNSEWILVKFWFWYFFSLIYIWTYIKGNWHKNFNIYKFIKPCHFSLLPGVSQASVLCPFLYYVSALFSQYMRFSIRTHYLDFFGQRSPWPHKTHVWWLLKNLWKNTLENISIEGISYLAHAFFLTIILSHDSGPADDIVTTFHIISHTELLTWGFSFHSKTARYTDILSCVWSSHVSVFRNQF